MAAERRSASRLWRRVRGAFSADLDAGSVRKISGGASLPIVGPDGPLPLPGLRPDGEIKGSPYDGTPKGILNPKRFRHQTALAAEIP